MPDFSYSPGVTNARPSQDLPPLPPQLINFTTLRFFVHGSRSMMVVEVVVVRWGGGHGDVLQHLLCRTS